MSFETIMLGIALVQMGSSVINSGVQSAKHAGDIRKSIEQMSDKSKTVKEQFKKLAKDEAKTNAALMKDVTAMIEEQQQIQAQMYVAKNNFVQQQAHIQTMGIVFVISMAFILLLKRIGFSKMVTDWVISLFKS